MKSSPQVKRVHDWSALWVRKSSRKCCNSSAKFSLWISWHFNLFTLSGWAKVLTSNTPHCSSCVIIILFVCILCCITFLPSVCGVKPRSTLKMSICKNKLQKNTEIRRFISCLLCRVCYRWEISHICIPFIYLNGFLIRLFLSQIPVFSMHRAASGGAVTC